MTTTQPISLLDLTMEQVENIERHVGAPMTAWPSGVESVADLYARIYAAGSGTPVKEAKAMSLNDLMAKVALSDAEQAAAAEPDPEG